MKDLQSYYLKCLKELSDINLKPGKINKIYVNENLKSVWGKCRHKKKFGYYEIEINPVLVQDDTPDSSLKNTIMHEILHTFEGALNHGKIWKELATKVNNSYPEYNIKRVTPDKEKGLNIDYRYTLVCQKCKDKIGFHKKCKTVTYYEYYRCHKCNGKFDLIVKD